MLGDRARLLGFKIPHFSKFRKQQFKFKQQFTRLFTNRNALLMSTTNSY